MEKQNQPGGFSVPEVPPAYFPPVVSQPGGMTNSENYPMSYNQPFGMPGVHPGQTGPSAPAQYQNQAMYPGQYVQPVFAQFVPESPNLMHAILAREDKVSFHSNQRIATGVVSSFIVQIRGNQNQLLMSALLTTVAVPTAIATNGYGNSRVLTEPRSTITFNDPTGRNLMTCKQFQNELHVIHEDQFLGIIRGGVAGCACVGSSIHAENSNGELYFETENKGSEYHFVRNGIKIATARRGVTSGDDFGVEFLGAVDAQAKAMIVAVSYNLYVLHFAETTCGCSGTLTCRIIMLMIPLIVFITFGIIMAIIFTTVI